MKISIVRGARNSGAIYQLDTSTNESKELFWSPPPGDDRIISLFVGGSIVRGALASTGPIVYRAVTGDALSAATPSVLTPLAATSVANVNMTVSPDGRFAVGLSAAGGEWVSVDFSPATPSITSQAVGTFPKNSSIAMMSFEGGENRLVVVDGSSGVMLLSTPIGSGVQIDAALSVPLSSVPDRQDFEGYAVNGAVMLGKLASAAKAAGFGNPSLMDLWIVAADGQGGYISALYSGMCTAATDSGMQLLGFLEGITLKEAQVQQDASYSLKYSKPLPDDIVSGQGSSGLFFYLPTPSNPQKSPFWTNFISCFEVA